MAVVGTDILILLSFIGLFCGVLTVAEWITKLFVEEKGNEDSL